MKKYYTRVCNFYYGNLSSKLVKQKKTLPLNGNTEISFDHIEILSRNSSKKIRLFDPIPHGSKGFKSIDLNSI